MDKANQEKSLAGYIEMEHIVVHPRHVVRLKAASRPLGYIVQNDKGETAFDLASSPAELSKVVLGEIGEAMRMVDEVDLAPEITRTVAVTTVKASASTETGWLILYLVSDGTVRWLKGGVS